VIDIGEILILDKTKADTLLSLGFKYTKRNIDNKEMFVFPPRPKKFPWKATTDFTMN